MENDRFVSRRRAVGWASGLALGTLALLGNAPAALAEAVVVPLTLLNAEGLGDPVGTVTLEDSEYGLLITPDLSNLPSGLHGFHIHANGSCAPALRNGQIVPGLAAGGHFDPTETGSHEGPYSDGHLGDLPPLYVDDMGMATMPVLAPRLTVADVDQRAIMVHAMGDNFSDEPSPLGGGGGRIACGVIALN